MATPASAPRSTQRQDSDLVSRVCELGRAGASVIEIDKTLHREQFKTSTGTPWPAKNDGRVVVRTLLRHGIEPVPGDAKIKKYVQEYSAKLGAGGASQSQPSRPSQPSRASRPAPPSGPSQPAGAPTPHRLGFAD